MFAHLGSAGPIFEKCVQFSSFGGIVLVNLGFKTFIANTLVLLSYVCDERAKLPRSGHDQNRARVYLSAAASSAAARVETAEKTAEKKSLEAVGLEPQDTSCSRRVRSAESGVEGKSLSV